MAKDGEKKQDDQSNGGAERLTREEYDRLVQGVDDIFFGGNDEPPVVKPSSVEKSGRKKSNDGDDGK